MTSNSSTRHRRAYNVSYPPLWMHCNALWVCTQCTASQPNLKLWPANFWKSEGLTSRGGGGSRCERTWASALPRTLRPSPHPRCPSTRWVVGEWKSGTLSLFQFPSPVLSWNFSTSYTCHFGKPRVLEWGISHVSGCAHRYVCLPITQKHVKISK